MLYLNNNIGSVAIGNTSLQEVYWGGDDKVFGENHKTFTLYKNIDIKEQVEEIQELFKECVNKAYSHNGNTYYVHTTINNKKLTCIFACGSGIYVNSAGDRYEYGTTYLDYIIDINTNNIHSLDEVQNDLLNILNTDLISCNFKFDTDVVNIKIL